MAGINVKMVEDLQVLRKYNMDLIYIAPSESTIDKELVKSDYLDGFYDKYSIKHLSYTDVFQNNRLDMYISNGIPLTSIKFDSLDPATFTEHGSLDDQKTYFADEKLEALRRWSLGEKAQQLGLSRKTIQQWIRKLTEIELNKRLLFPQRSSEDNTEGEGNKQEINI